MLGWAGYSYPKSYLETYPDASIDVVEIDPGITEIAKKHFWLRADPRLHIIHEDARVFLNTNTHQYDAILGDAFSSWYSLPYQLTTQEAVQKHYESLTETGVVILNIIGALEGEMSDFFRAEYHTYASVFPYVQVFPVHDPKDTHTIQNIILVALKTPPPPPQNTDPQMSAFLSHQYTWEISHDLPLLTDEYAPVEHYVSKYLQVLNP